MVPPSQLVPPHDCCGDMLRKFRSLTRQKASNLTRFNNDACFLMPSVLQAASTPTSWCLLWRAIGLASTLREGWQKSRKTRELQRLLEVDLALRVRGSL